MYCRGLLQTKQNLTLVTYMHKLFSLQQPNQVKHTISLYLIFTLEGSKPYIRYEGFYIDESQTLETWIYQHFFVLLCQHTLISGYT